jgi:hypothetical protein
MPRIHQTADIQTSYARSLWVYIDTTIKDIHAPIKKTLCSPASSPNLLRHILRARFSFSHFTSRPFEALVSKQSYLLRARQVTQFHTSSHASNVSSEASGLGLPIVSWSMARIIIASYRSVKLRRRGILWLGRPRSPLALVTLLSLLPL